MVDMVGKSYNVQFSLEEYSCSIGNSHVKKPFILLHIASTTPQRLASITFEHNPNFKIQ